MRYGIAIDVDLSEFKVTQIQDYLESIGWSAYNKREVTVNDLIDQDIISIEDIKKYLNGICYTVTREDVLLNDQLDHTELWALIDLIDKTRVKVGSNLYSTRQKLHEAAIKQKD